MNGLNTTANGTILLFSPQMKSIPQHLLLFSLAFFAGLVLHGQEFKRFYFENGKVSSEGWMREGKPDGYWKTFYEAGNIKTEGNRKDFKLDSLWKFYRADSTLERTITYKEDLKDGAEQLFDDKGILSEQYTWKNSIREGESLTWYPGESALWRRIPFVNNKEEGKGFEYDRDGRIITLLTYRNGFIYLAEKINRYDSSGRKTGNWVEYWSEGKMKEEGNWTQGKRNGVFRFFKRNGDLDKIEEYVDGNLVTGSDSVMVLDIRKEYYDDGRLKMVGSYRDNKRQGTFREYSEDGVPLNSYFYENDIKTGEGLLDSLGLRQGPWKLFYLSGELRAEGEYKDGKKEGPWKFYFRDGKKEQQGNYREDLATGAWKWYYNNGSIHRDEIYRKGKEDGHAVEYDSLGVVVSEGDFIDGYKTGKWLLHVNDHLEEGEYLDGERTGEWVYRYPDGQLAFEGEFLGGLPVGKHKYWYPNGAIKMKGEYEGGVLDGTWQYYEESGTLSMEIEYKLGDVYRVNGVKMKVPQKDVN